VKQFTADEVWEILGEFEGGPTVIINTINGWLERGDGVAVYRNQDLGHPDVGHLKLMSYGSVLAQIESDEPPTTLPDIGNAINWRYQLEGVYRSGVGSQLVTP
jgi:hypothetical protein